MDRMDEIALEDAVASMEIEGFHVTKSDIALAKRCLSGEISYDDAVAMVIRGDSASHDGA
ncbi:MAG: antitoxin VbhA family protein [Methanomethylophilus sp.]|jgi:hypothetical protein